MDDGALVHYFFKFGVSGKIEVPPKSSYRPYGNNPANCPQKHCVTGPRDLKRTFRAEGFRRINRPSGFLQSVCNEFPDNGQEHWIGKASDAQTKAVAVAPEVLAKYIGVYKGIYLRNAEVVEVTLSDGKLFVAINGGEKRVVFPQSETNFAGTGFGYRFIRME
jgi:hypothetical protein